MAVRASLTVSIDVLNDCFAIFAVNKSVVDWLPSNYDNQPQPRATPSALVGYKP